MGDTTTLVETLTRAADHLTLVAPTGLTEIVADKGYHSNQTLVEFAEAGVRTYVSEPDRGRRTWKGQAAAKQAVYASKRLLRYGLFEPMRFEHCVGEESPARD